MTLLLNGTTGVSAVDGSASTPALQGNDANTGVFFPAADTVGISTNGTERLRVDSSGNVGIGTSSPGAKLVVDGGTSADQFRLGTGSNYYSIGRESVSTGLLTFYGTQAGANGYVFGGVDGERMRINASGNVGIGTSSPLGRFTSERAASSAGWVLAGKSAGISNESGVYIDASNNAEFAARNGSTTLTVRIGSSGDSYINAGNVGIGTNSPSFRATINFDAPATWGNATGNFCQMWQNSGTNAIGINIGDNNIAGITTNNSYNLVLATQGSERVRVNTSGDVTIGTTNNLPGYLNSVTGVALQQDGTSCFSKSGNITTVINNNGSGQSLTQYSYQGTYTGQVILNGTTGVLYVTASDYRLKENVVPLDNALARVSSLKPSRFNFKTEPGRTVDGFIAHEVQEVIPDAVSGQKDGAEMQSVDYGKLTPLLTAAIQELKAELDAVKAELAALKGVA